MRTFEQDHVTYQAAGSVPWTEKYRPEKLDEIQGDGGMLDALGRLAREGLPQHIILAGPPGTGKTTAAHVIVKVALGENASIDELNASDERGILTVRETIREYAETVPLDGGSFKVLILDEADNMTRDAQPALKRIMEKNVRNCKFILTANDMDGIIEPIQSRCDRFYFAPIPQDIVVSVIGAIAEREGFDITQPAADVIAMRAKGDLRRAINWVEMCAKGKTYVDVNDVIMIVPERGQKYSEIVDKALMGNFNGAVEQYWQLFKGGPVGASDFIDLVAESLSYNTGYAPKNQVDKRIALALGDVRLGQGKNDYLQVMAFLARLSS